MNIEDFKYLEIIFYNEYDIKCASYDKNVNKFYWKDIEYEDFKKIIKEEKYYKINPNFKTEIGNFKMYININYFDFITMPKKIKHDIHNYKVSLFYNINSISFESPIYFIEEIDAISFLSNFRKNILLRI